MGNCSGKQQRGCQSAPILLVPSSESKYVTCQEVNKSDKFQDKSVHASFHGATGVRAGHHGREHFLGKEHQFHGGRDSHLCPSTRESYHSTTVSSKRDSHHKRDSHLSHHRGTRGDGRDSHQTARDSHPLNNSCSSTIRSLPRDSTNNTRSLPRDSSNATTTVPLSNTTSRDNTSRDNHSTTAAASRDNDAIPFQKVDSKNFSRRGDSKKPSTPVKNPVVTRRKSLETLVRYHTHDISLDYEIDEKEVCGSGYSGPVLIARSKSHGHTNKQYAVKTFKKKELCPKKMQFLKSEVNIYLKLDHPHITRLFEVYENDEKLYLVMEFCGGGELYHRLSQKKIFPEKSAADTCYQMLLALSYLHNNNIVHRDLKLENWLYESKKEDSKLKLIDFGFSKVFDQNTRMHQACGSVAYVAPEVLRRSYSGGGCDLWSLGVIVFMLLSGYPPFYARTEDKMIVLIEKGKYHMRPERWDRISLEAKDFVKRLLEMDESKRMTAEQALKHAWIRQMRNNGAPTNSNGASTIAARATSVIPANLMAGLRQYASASHLKRAVLCTIAYTLDSTEIAGLREIFLQIDKTRCGTISLVDFRDAIKQANSKISTEEIRQVFKCLDHDNHGCIEYSTLIAALLESQVGLKSGLVRDAFDKFDTAGEGILTAKVLSEQFENSNILSEVVEKRRKDCLYYDEFVNHICSAADISTIAGPSMAATSSSNASTAKSYGRLSKLSNFDISPCPSSYATCENTPRRTSKSGWLPRFSSRPKWCPSEGSNHGTPKSSHCPKSSTTSTNAVNSGLKTRSCCNTILENPNLERAVTAAENPEGLADYAEYDAQTEYDAYDARTVTEYDTRTEYDGEDCAFGRVSTATTIVSCAFRDLETCSRLGIGKNESELLLGDLSRLSLKPGKPIATPSLLGSSAATSSVASIVSRMTDCRSAASRMTDCRLTENYEPVARTTSDNRSGLFLNLPDAPSPYEDPEYYTGYKSCFGTFSCRPSPRESPRKSPREECGGSPRDDRPSPRDVGGPKEFPRSGETNGDDTNGETKNGTLSSSTTLCSTTTRASPRSKTVETDMNHASRDTESFVCNGLMCGGISSTNDGRSSHGSDQNRGVTETGVRAADQQGGSDQGVVNNGGSTTATTDRDGPLMNLLNMKRQMTDDTPKYAHTPATVSTVDSFAHSINGKEIRSSTTNKLLSSASSHSLYACYH